MRHLLAIALVLAAAAVRAQEAEDGESLVAADDGIPTLVVTGLRPQDMRVPPQLSPAQRAAYRQVFRDIAAGRLAQASAGLAAMPRGLLHATAESQILLRRGTSAGRAALVSWLEANPDAPQARDILALARRTGAADLPPIASERALVPVRLTPSMGPRGSRLETPVDTEFAGRARALIAQGRAEEVNGLLDRFAPELTTSVRSEWAARAAWDRYLALDDPGAKALAARAADGSGDWAAFGNWVGGLAAFRLGDCEAAARHFDGIGRQFANDELRSSGAFWAARAHVRCGRPEQAESRLKVARDADPTGFYGLLAARVLGLEPAFDWREPDFITADWTTLSGLAGARRSVALMEVGEIGLADRELRHLARTADPQFYEPILRLAARLDLPATQYWLAANPPPGMRAPMAARFPTPNWRPVNGWRVDRNLVFAHAMQESRFITTARSPAGARGVMQLMPGTARELSRVLVLPASDAHLADPSFNVEFGQAYLEMLRDSPATLGLLPKVIAAYNAGPGSVGRWNTGEMRYNNDVLLFIESIPFRETRHYVEVVLRNYWLYEMKAAAEGAPAASSSLSAIAANLWPRFPGLPGAAAVPFPGAPAIDR
ncbi:lytic transglycosylase domain-containing protein [Thermaurantiacus tibetensis]|uniref:lytic transglycosylase domain-containing protein n=1 Tax=Thermaurantiacus tibetensis TaxID=2759035 RepID=UPI00188E26F6|nr:lytic transglycosylase domain-containing protein [Thermaurantiacus tibetensis]